MKKSHLVHFVISFLFISTIWSAPQSFEGEVQSNREVALVQSFNCSSSEAKQKLAASSNLVESVGRITRQFNQLIRIEGRSQIKILSGGEWKEFEEFHRQNSIQSMYDLNYLGTNIIKVKNILKCMEEKALSVEVECVESSRTCNELTNQRPTIAYAKRRKFLVCPIYFKLTKQCDIFPARSRLSLNDELNGILVHELSHICGVNSDARYFRSAINKQMCALDNGELVRSNRGSQKNGMSQFPLQEQLSNGAYRVNFADLADIYRFWAIKGFCLPGIKDCPSFDN
jgi:hypothetical protein